MPIFNKIFKNDVKSNEETDAVIHEDNVNVDSVSNTQNKLSPLKIGNRYSDRFVNVLCAMVQTYGAEFLMNPLSINILSDYMAFETNKSYKYILKSLINDRIIALVLAASTWDEKYERLIYRYIDETGFKDDLVWGIIYSVFQALGKEIHVPNRMEAIPQPKYHGNNVTPPMNEDKGESKATHTNYPWANHLTKLIGNLYLRKDWIDRSPIKLQNLNIEKNKYLSQYIVDFFLMNSSSAKLYGEPKFLSPLKDVICFYLLNIDKNNEIVSTKHLVNSLTRAKTSFTQIFPHTFEQYRFVIDFPKESSDKTIICVEYGFGKFCNRDYDIIDTRNYKDITNLVHFPDSISDEFSFVRFYYFDQMVKVYLERDIEVLKTKTKLHGDFHAYKIMVFTHDGKEKKVKGNLYLWFGREDMDKHYHITQEFQMNIPIQDISKIELIRD